MIPTTRPARVSLPMCSTRIDTWPSSTIVSAKTGLPVSLVTGRDLPVRTFWSTTARPLTTMPSTGLLVAG